jgi:DNA-binding transcriptional ArsR family regulator
VEAKRNSTAERNAVVERLREFIRFGYMTASEVARRIGVSDGTVYSWLLGEFQPTNPKRLMAFLDALPAESSSGIAPTGYEYREYKKLARYSKASTLPVLQTSKGRDPKGSRWLSRFLPELRSDGTEAGK